MSDKFYYTVEKLMEELRNMPGDMPVLISGSDNGFDNFYYPEIVKLKHDPDNFYDEGEFQPAEEDGDDSFDAVVLIRADRDDCGYKNLKVLFAVNINHAINIIRLWQWLTLKILHL